MAEISHKQQKEATKIVRSRSPRKKGVISKDQTIQESKKALRDLLERQTREATIAIEAIKRAEEMTNRQRAILEDAEKREQLELLKKSNKSLLLKGLIPMSFRGDRSKMSGDPNIDKRPKAQNKWCTKHQQRQQRENTKRLQVVSCNLSNLKEENKNSLGAKTKALNSNPKATYKVVGTNTTRPHRTDHPVLSCKQTSYALR
ncbi:hypothetical protein PIB30_031698 [Stylosanthes scabra]|uniref:Uncharacterized protein n=1 Tax=Stylosanthes scabra TaxID=79078 RepID=A0ABU6RCF4_9FABA|nr:hypothetical protein [Stylosanthes scabra]